jgi:hypothetical protein
VDRERFYLITEDGIYGEFEPLKEAQSLSRVWKHGQTGLAVLSAFRSEYSESENLKRHSKLKSILRSNDLGYWEVDGLYQDEDYRGADFTFNPDNPYDEELSCFVPYNPAAFDTFEDFAEFIEDVGIGEFDQDSVLLVSPDEEAYLVMKSGGIEKLGTRVSPDKVLAAHTKLRKGSHKGRGFIVEYAIRKAQSTNDAYAMRAQGIL